MNMHINHASHTTQTIISHPITYTMDFFIYQSFLFLILCIVLVLPSGNMKIPTEFHFQYKIYYLKSENNMTFSTCIPSLMNQ